MQRLLIKTLLLIGSVLFSACGNDMPDEQAEAYSGRRLSVDLRFVRAPATAAEEQIATVRVLAFDDQGALVFNKHTPLASSQGPQATVQASLATGYNNVYVVCNEPSELSARLAGIAQQDDLEQVAVPVQGVSTPLPMYGKVLGVWVKANADGSGATVTVNGTTSTSLEVSVDRLVAKLSTTIVKNSAGALEAFTVERLSYRILRLPRYVGLRTNTPYGHNLWAENIEQSSTTRLATDGIFEQVGDDYRVKQGDAVQFTPVYLPEHILARRDDPTLCTYMEVTALCRTAGGVESSSTYRLDLGQEPPLNLNIERNDHHKIYATITQLNGGFSVQMQLAPWKDGETIKVEKPDGTPYLNVSQVGVFEAIDAINDLGKTYSKRILFWSNQPYDKISMLYPTITYTDPSGAVFVGSDAYFEAKYTPGVDVRDDYVPQIELTPTKEPKKNPDDNNSGWVDVQVRMPARRMDWKNVEVSFIVQAGNLNRKVTLSYPTR